MKKIIGDHFATTFHCLVLKYFFLLDTFFERQNWPNYFFNFPSIFCYIFIDVFFYFCLFLFAVVVVSHFCTYWELYFPSINFCNSRIKHLVKMKLYFTSESHDCLDLFGVPMSLKMCLS